MKTNNTPEKIYVHKSQYWGLMANEYDMTGYDIEYIRTDAFIDKACKFFEENVEEEDCKIGSSEWTELRAEYKSLDSFIRAFRNYMKGE